MRSTLWLPALTILLASIWSPLDLRAQEQAYVPSSDPQVRETLEEWQDLKFGLLMHWGLYAQLGIVESWALCSEDQSCEDPGGVPENHLKGK